MKAFIFVKIFTISNKEQNICCFSLTFIYNNCQGSLLDNVAVLLLNNCNYSKSVIKL